MPKVNEYYSQVRPSTLTGGALITNPEAIANTGEQYVAGAIGHLGDLTYQLAQKEMAFNDSIASAKSTQIMRQAELEYQAKIENDPDTNNWGKYQQESISKAQQEIGKLKFGSGKGKKANEVETQAWGNLFGTQAQVQMIKQKKQDTLAITEANYEVAVTSMDGKPTSVTRVAQTGEEYKKALYAVYPKEMADQIFIEKDAKIKKAITKDSLSKMAFQMVSTPDETGKPIGYQKTLEWIGRPETIQELQNAGYDVTEIPKVMEEIKKMAKLGEENQVYASNQDKNSIIADMNKSKNLPPDQRVVKAAEFTAFLEKSNITGDDRLQWQKTINDWSINPMQKDDPTVVAKLYPQMLSGQLSQQKILDNVGKGLSMDTAQKWIEQSPEWTNYTFKDTDRFLKNMLGWNDQLTTWTRPQDGVAYERVLTDLKKAVKEEGLKGEKVKEKAVELSLPYIVDHFKAMGQSQNNIDDMVKMLRGNSNKTVVPKTLSSTTGQTMAQKEQEMKDKNDPLGIFK